MIRASVVAIALAISAEVQAGEAPPAELEPPPPPPPGASVPESSPPVPSEPGSSPPDIGEPVSTAPDLGKPRVMWTGLPPKPAEPPVDRPIEEPAEPPTESRWYGNETLSVDAAALGLVIAGGTSGSAELALIGVLGYCFGPPIAHFSHGNVGRGFGSFGIRIGLPIGGALAGLAMSDESNDGGEGIVAGFVLGVAGAVTIDAAALAYERVPVEKPRASRPLRLTPTAFVTRRAAGLAVVGTF